MVRTGVMIRDQGVIQAMKKAGIGAFRSFDSFELRAAAAPFRFTNAPEILPKLHWRRSY